LEAAGTGEIVVANRDIGRAERLAHDLDPAPVRPVRLDEEMLTRELLRAELLVNATSLGWHTGESPIALENLDLLPAGAVVADLTYRDTDLLLAAQACGLKTVDGLPMLVHQGARAFELWTGAGAPVETMLTTARAARASARS
jgi:shikimate dehydrogenase